jgi:integrative and conjugative element protein (TIGR02256 family)
MLAVRPARRMIEYPIGSSGQMLQVGDDVLKHFWRNRQRRPWMPEAGGQLFGRLNGTVVKVTEATGPRPNDKRSPWSYEPCRADEQTEIDDRHGAGLLFLGDWHTHWQRHPRPSQQDRGNVADIVRQSRFRMNGLVLVIVGFGRPPAGLYVAVADELYLHQLQAGV